jgi:hypothetical protein
VFWHLGFDDLNGFGDGFWVGVNGNGGQCQSFACTDISATAPPKKTVLTVDTMENTVRLALQQQNYEIRMALIQASSQMDL